MNIIFTSLQDETTVAQKCQHKNKFENKLTNSKTQKQIRRRKNKFENTKTNSKTQKQIRKHKNKFENTKTNLEGLSTTTTCFGRGGQDTADADFQHGGGESQQTLWKLRKISKQEHKFCVDCGTPLADNEESIVSSPLSNKLSNIPKGKTSNSPSVPRIRKNHSFWRQRACQPEKELEDEGERSR